MNSSYSQNSEDLVLLSHFRDVKEDMGKGTYIDIGAHHPSRFNNTKIFYDLGWRGINIDGLDGTKKLFNKYRPGDINLEVIVGGECGESIFYEYEEGALSNSTEDQMQIRLQQGFSPIKSESKRVVDLNEIFVKYVCDREVDFLFIDVQGDELNVIKGNDFNKNRPKCIVVGFDNNNLFSVEEHPITIYLLGFDYVPLYKCVYNTFYFKPEALIIGG